MDMKDFQEGYAEGEEPLVFHYNREERIKNAPELVQKYYAGELKAFKPGLFRALVSTKANRFMFFALVVCVILAGFIGWFGPAKNAEVLDGIPMELSAFSYEDTIYASLKLEIPQKKSRKSYEGQSKSVTAVFYALDADNQTLFSEETSGIYKGEELFLRTTFRDYDIFNITADVNFASSEEEPKKLSCRVERR